MPLPKLPFDGLPYEPIGGIRTIFDAMQVMRKTCLNYGFKCFNIMTLPTVVAEEDSTIAGLSIISTWPPELIGEYDRLGLGKNSPVFGLLRNRITPLLFQVEDINRGRPKDEYPLASELFARFGLTMGVYFPVHDGQGLRHAVSFVGDRDFPGADELSTLAMFSTLMIEQLTKITTVEGAARSALNARETEVLQWTAEGKTSAEIARITGLSEHTINHYATIATQKLGCSNRTQAVVYAMRLGLFR